MDKNDKIREGPVQINDLNNYKPEVNSPVPNVQCFPSNNMGSIWNLFHVALFNLPVQLLSTFRKIYRRRGFRIFSRLNNPLRNSTSTSWMNHHATYGGTPIWRPEVMWHHVITIYLPFLACCISYFFFTNFAGNVLGSFFGKLSSESF